MKKTILISIIVLSLSVFIFSGCTRQESQIGVLNMEEVIAESKRAQQLSDELSEIGSSLEEEYAEKEEEAEEEELDRIYQQFQEKKENLEDELNQEVNQVLSDIADEENVDVVVLAKFIQYGGKDITEKTTERLDEEYYEE
ncbi:MAG: hypothetical protein ACOC1S_01865 [bacterium]